MIRLGTPSDEAEVLRLIDAWPTHFVEAAKPLVKRDFRSGKAFIYEQAGSPLGFVVWRESPDEIELLWLAVHPKALRSGIGRALVAEVESRVTSKGRIFLRTATTDSIIPGTDFDGRAYQGTNDFFTTLGYRSVERIPNGWGPGNHCLIMEKRAHTQIMPTKTDNELLAGLGRYIRPLLSEAGNAMKMPNAGFIGICFPNPKDADSRVLFAEFVNPDNRQDKYEGDYILPSACAFVRAIGNAAQDKKVWHYAVTADEPEAVKAPLAKEFPNAAAPQAIFAYRLSESGDDATIYFIAESEAAFEQFLLKLDTAKAFLIKTIRDALFLAAAADAELGEWSEKLLGKLPEVFPTYTDAQKRALAKVRHPYLQWQEGRTEVPNVSGSIQSEDDKQWLSAIRGADEVKVTGLLSGSFQDHNVYSAEVRTAGGAKPFEAAIKAAPQGRADKEVRGYFSLLPYFRHIREVMPSAPLIFPTGQKTKKNEDQYTVVTPHLGGQSLYDFIKEEWHGDADRVVKLRPVFRRLRKEFIENIRPPQGIEEPVAPFQRLYESHLSDEQRKPGNRFDKTKDQLTARLPTDSESAPTLSFLGEALVNPLWVLRSAPLETQTVKIDSFWQSTPRQRRMLRYGHGDFHVGNVLFKREDGRVTVLDFDYVGDHPEHEDPATLEASLVLAVAASPPFQDSAKWHEVWPDAVRFLAGALPFNEVENNRLAHDLTQLVVEIRGQALTLPQNCYMPDNYHYHACLATALLRLFTSHSQKMVLSQFKPVGATALFWLGLLLRGLVRAQENAQPLAIDFFYEMRQPENKKSA